ncbi:unnamed protein product, partial [Rotaria sp. Silwood2]
HSLQYSHPPLRKELCLTGTCKQINDIIDIFLLIHRNPLEEIVKIQNHDHEKAYRYLTLCKDFQKFLEYQKHTKSHCE